MALAAADKSEFSGIRFFDVHDTKGQKDRFCSGKLIASIGALSAVTPAVRGLEGDTALSALRRGEVEKVLAAAETLVFVLYLLATRRSSENRSSD